MLIKQGVFAGGKLSCSNLNQVCVVPQSKKKTSVQCCHNMKKHNWTQRNVKFLSPKRNVSKVKHISGFVQTCIGNHLFWWLGCTEDGGVVSVSNNCYILWYDYVGVLWCKPYLDPKITNLRFYYVLLCMYFIMFFCYCFLIFLMPNIRPSPSG